MINFLLNKNGDKTITAEVEVDEYGDLNLYLTNSRGTSKVVFSIDHTDGTTTMVSRNIREILGGSDETHCDGASAVRIGSSSATSETRD